jgi:hypothetical protein
VNTDLKFLPMQKEFQKMKTTGHSPKTSLQSGTEMTVRTLPCAGLRLRSKLKAGSNATSGSCGKTGACIQE